MSYFKKAAVSASLLSATLLSTAVPTLAAVPNYNNKVSVLVNYLKSQQDATGVITGFGGETAWAVMGFSSVGIDPHTVQNGGVSVVDYLANNAPSTTTGWERDLLAVVAAGENPTIFGGHNYVTQIESAASGGQLGSATGINDDTFGILSLVAAGSATSSVISDSVDFVIANQNSDGGWSYSVGNTSDNGDTAIAIQALQAAKNAGFSNSGIDNAITTGLAYLKANQNSDGGWGYAGTGFSDAASTAWAVLVVTGDDSAVTNGLNFIVSKQDVNCDANFGGVDGGYGVETYTSSNSLIAFGQQAFPVPAFSNSVNLGTAPACVDPNANNNPPVTNPGNNNNNNSNNSNNSNNTNGQVLAATTSNNNGQVLASILPDTATIPTLADLIPADAYKARPIEVNMLLLIGLVVLEVGLGLKLVASRLGKNIVE